MMVHSKWKKFTGQERLYRMERKLQKKMLNCKNEEEWKKLNQRRKQIRQKRLRIQKYSRIILVGCALLFLTGSLGSIWPVCTGGEETKQEKVFS